MPKHPLFAIQDTETLSCLRVLYKPSTQPNISEMVPLAPADVVPSRVIMEGVPGNYLTIEIIEETPDDTNSQYFSTIEEIENGAIDLILNTISVKSSNTYDHHAVSGTIEISPAHQAQAIIPILIMRQCNLIATRNRRGSGNIVVVSRFIADLFASPDNPFVTYSDTTADVLVMPGSKIVHVGTLNNSQHIYVHQDWPDDHPIIIGYIGDNHLVGREEEDAGLFCSHLDDTYRLSYFAHNERNLGSWIDYYGVVGIAEGTVEAIRENVFVPSEAPVEQEVVDDGELRFS